MYIFPDPFLLVEYSLRLRFIKGTLFVSLSFLKLLQIPSVKELRKLMRIQALRCHVVCCQNGNRLNVIPVLASRSQALRYVLSVTHYTILQLLINLIVHFFGTLNITKWRIFNQMVHCVRCFQSSACSDYLDVSLR